MTRVLAARGGGVRRPDARTGAPEPPAGDAMALARIVGNRGMLRALGLQRVGGWEGEPRGSANRDESTTTAPSGGRVRRIPLDGIDTPDAFSRKAIVVLPQPIPPGVALDVLLHLHGFQLSGYAAGYDDPAGREPPADVGVYQIEAQMAAASRPMIGVLPQGSPKSDFNRISDKKAFDADHYLGAVFARLTQIGAWTGGGREGPVPEPPARGRVVLSGHSGADQPITEMLESAGGPGDLAPDRLGGLFLFDSMYPGGKDKKGRMTFEGKVEDYVIGRLEREVRELDALRTPTVYADAADTAMVEHIEKHGFRVSVAYLPGGTYERAGLDLKKALDAWFASPSAQRTIGPPSSGVHMALRANYRVVRIPGGPGDHMKALALGDGLRTAIEMMPPPEPVPAAPLPARTAPGADADRAAEPALSRAAAAVARAPDPKKAPTPAPAQVKVTIRWDHSEPPKTYLKKAFDATAVDWSANVSVDGKSVGSGKGSLEVTLAEGSTHTVHVAPTAAAPADYFHPGVKKKAKVVKDGEIKVTLPFNRENDEFTKQSWIEAKLDPKKVSKVKGTTMLGKSVTVNEEALDTVNATNKYFNGPNLSDQEREEVTDSIVTMGGYNTRTQSTGAYSNHSTGCAVDINENMDLHMAHHWKKTNKGDKELFELFARVVKLEPTMATYDPWKTTDADTILKASDTFNERFPNFLIDLLVDSGATGTEHLPLAKAFGNLFDIGPWLVQNVDAAMLKRAQEAATKAKKTTTAARLKEISAHWASIRAWVEGIVVYSRKKGGKGPSWAYVSEHEARVAAGTEKGTVKGELHGMLPLHPKLVETMREGGWTWLVDAQHAKDLMHFEDREAEKALKA